ncbi:MAG: hypothetical protein AVDCRST_MAG64-703, partial [uncultured Phycisphaerae bacterium]
DTAEHRAAGRVGRTRPLARGRGGARERRGLPPEPARRRHRVERRRRADRPAVWRLGATEGDDPRGHGQRSRRRTDGLGLGEEAAGIGPSTLRSWRVM